MKVMDFEMVSSKVYKIHRLLSGVSEYLPIIFEEDKAALMSVTVFSAVL
jgi:hypothetical protein